MRELIGWGCGVVATIAAIGLVYGVTVWRFGDAQLAHLDGDD